MPNIADRIYTTKFTQNSVSELSAPQFAEASIAAWDFCLPQPWHEVRDDIPDIFPIPGYQSTPWQGGCLLHTVSNRSS